MTSASSTAARSPSPLTSSHVSGVVGIGWNQAGPAGGSSRPPPMGVVVHVNAYEAAPQLHLDSNDAIGIFPRPIPNRVPERFGEGGAEIEADAAGRQRTGRKVSRDQLDGVAHHPEIARDVEPHRARRHIKS